MDRPTRHVLISATALLALSAAVACTRYNLLDGDLSGLTNRPRWRVAIRIKAFAKRKESYVKLLVPAKSDAQQITAEDVQEKGMTPHFVNEGLERNRVLVWQNGSVTGPKTMSFSFVVQPQPGEEPSPIGTKKQRNAVLSECLRGTTLIQASAPLIQQKAQELTEQITTLDRKVDAIYSFCTYSIANNSVPGTMDALRALTEENGDCGGKSRLMVAMCRAVGIPARLVGGMILNEGIKRESHVWVEVWQDNTWVPYCPLNRHYRKMPGSYLLIYRGDYPLMRHRYMDDFTYEFSLTRLAAHTGDTGMLSNRWHTMATLASFSHLSPSGQWALRFLLLIPLGALVVCILRNIVGIPTLGTFAPVLISLGVHLAPLRWGIFTLVAFIGIGLLVRWVMDGLKLLLVPRLSVMLTVVIIGMIIFVVITDQVETELGVVVGLLPVVILTMSIERCWLLEIEDGFLNMSKHLLGTLASVVVICLVFRWKALTTILFAMPELLLALIAVMLLLGRYSGFRLSEFLRFRAMADVQRR